MSKHFAQLFLVIMLTTGLFSCAVKKGNDMKDMSSAPFEVKVKPSLAEVDNLGRLYVVNDRNTIINYKPDLTEQYQYANKKSGTVTSLDVTNPLKIVVFFDDFNQVKILDNTLSLITELDLSARFADVSACSVTNDGNLWIFDPVQFKLIKIRENGTVIFESSNVNDFGMAGVRITDIREKGNYVMLCDREKGFYFFDNLGQYLYHFPVTTGIKSVQFDGKNVYYYSGTGLKSYSVRLKEVLMIGYPLEMNREGLMYILYQGGNYFEINKSGINRQEKT